MSVDNRRVVMLIPIVMVVLSLTLVAPAIKWVSLGAASFLVLFNLAGLSYSSVYDNLLIVVGFVFNGLIVWPAWRWVRYGQLPWSRGRAFVRAR